MFYKVILQKQQKNTADKTKNKEKFIRLKTKKL